MVPLLEEQTDLGEDSVIIDEGISISGKRRVYVLQTTEEVYTFLTLRYGSKNVWKR
jgi:hypothetical protein